MSARLRAIAAETAAVVEEGSYRAPSGRIVEFGALVSDAIAGTRMYGPDVPAEWTAKAATGKPPRVEVTGETSLEAARRLLDDSGEPVAVLNFASARNPGGGFLNGAKAQEEDLCRHSALYACLRGVRGYYDVHRADGNALYSHRVILSPDVPVIRGEDGALLEEPFTVGFLTAAAPNAGVIAQRAPEDREHIPGVLRERAERLLQVAALGGYRRLVLGAWGCGVFQNDPVEVAGAFHELLGPAGVLGGCFTEVVFAVFDRAEPSARREAFEGAFAG